MARSIQYPEEKIKAVEIVLRDTRRLQALHPDWSEQKVKETANDRGRKHYLRETGLTDAEVSKGQFRKIVDATLRRLPSELEEYLPGEEQDFIKVRGWIDLEDDEYRAFRERLVHLAQEQVPKNLPRAALLLEEIVYAALKSIVALALLQCEETGDIRHRRYSRNLLFGYAKHGVSNGIRGRQGLLFLRLVFTHYRDLPKDPPRRSGERDCSVLRRHLEQAIAELVSDELCEPGLWETVKAEKCPPKPRAEHPAWIRKAFEEKYGPDFWTS